MKKNWTLFLMIGLIGFFASCEKQSVAPEDASQSEIALKKAIVKNNLSCGEPFVTDLVAGQNDVVGSVSVVQNGNTIDVTYTINAEDVMITETHLDVEGSFMNFPMGKKGNPKIGNFDYKDEFDTPVTEVTYTVDIEGYSTVAVAAHAVVVYSDGTVCNGISSVEALIPDTPVSLTWQYTKTESYYIIGVSNAGAFDGDHLGWCADNNWAPVHYSEATLVSSYDTSATLLASIVDVPENLDKLNYLMNTYKDSQPFPVVQAATWVLMNGFFNNPSGGVELTPEQETALAEVMADVNANGEGYVPGCGEFLVVLINSGDSRGYQNTFILYPIEGEVEYSSETAWGLGNPFGGGSWAMYFDYCLAGE